ncbi:MAG: NHLP leader peptide family RiPP precursor [Peptococcaceae bacterium]|jgi:hypothetical protein|nr:NHLP leader peptide family RiPP precursor [Peptococcaceae bacterium]
MSKEEHGKKMGQIIAKAWGDDAFKRRLLGDASTVLNEEGVEIPPGLEVRAVENTDRVFYLVLPPKPNAELTDEQLDTVAGGRYLCGGSGPAPMDVHSFGCRSRSDEGYFEAYCLYLKKGSIPQPN